MAAASLVLVGTAHAQTPPDAGSQFSEQQRLQRLLPDRLPQAEQAEPVRPALRSTGGERIFVRQIRFTGAINLVPEVELHALLADAIGKYADFAGLEELAHKVTEHLKKAGFLLAQAYLPRQDVTDGTLEIAILPGRLDSGTEPFRVVPGGKLALRIAPERLTAIAARQLHPGAVVQDDDLQRALLLMNDLPGVSARSRLEPGADPDSTRVIIDVEQGPVLAATASIDNYGGRYTGATRAVASVKADDPWGAGDRIGLMYTQTYGSENLSLNYSLPLGADGLRLGLSGSAMHSRTGKEFANLGSESESESIGINLTYPIVRSRRANLAVSVSADHRTYLDLTKGAVTNDRIGAPRSLAFSGDLLDSLGGGGLTQAGIALVTGNITLNTEAVRTGDATGAQTQGNYRKFTWSISRLQRFDRNWSLLVAVNGQEAGKNLDSSEKFSLGGSTGVRAYSGGEGQGDEGRVITAELRRELGGSAIGQWQMSGFIDHGRTIVHHTPWTGSITNATNSNIYDLKGFGMALQFSKPGSHSLRLVAARRLGDNPGRTQTGKDSDGLAEKSRFWIQGMFWF